MIEIKSLQEVEDVDLRPYKKEEEGEDANYEERMEFIDAERKNINFNEVRSLRNVNLYYDDDDENPRAFKSVSVSEKPKESLVIPGTKSSRKQSPIFKPKTSAAVANNKTRKLQKNLFATLPKTSQIQAVASSSSVKSGVSSLSFAKAPASSFESVVPELSSISVAPSFTKAPAPAPAPAPASSSISAESKEAPKSSVLTTNREKNKRDNQGQQRQQEQQEQQQEQQEQQQQQQQEQQKRIKTDKGGRRPIRKTKNNKKNKRRQTKKKVKRRITKKRRMVKRHRRQTNKKH